MERKSKTEVLIFAQALYIFCFFVIMLFVAELTHFNCSGCILCGMTRAFRCMFRLDFAAAKQFNQYVYYVFSAFALAGADLIASAIYFCIKLKNNKS